MGKQTNTSIPIDSTHIGSGEIDAAILDAVRAIRYGSVEIVVHDSRVVQIECKERIRLVPSQGGRNGKP